MLLIADLAAVQDDMEHDSNLITLMRSKTQWMTHRTHLSTDWGVNL